MSVEYFIGRWEIARDIVDRRTSASGAFRGTAEFVPDEAGVRWIEDGELTWAGHRMSAGRRLRMVPGAEGRIDVFFDDGRYFHALDVAFKHDCAPDTYVGRLVIGSRDGFTLTWDVEGPATSIRISSSYLRAALQL
jgi:Family of unknown function (DUF6314)